MSDKILSKLPQKPQEGKPPAHAVAIVKHMERMKKEKRTGIEYAEAKRLEAAIRIGLEPQQLIIKKSKHPEFKDEVRTITIRAISSSEDKESFDMAVLLSGFDETRISNAYSEFQRDKKNLTSKTSYVVHTIMKCRDYALCLIGMADFDEDLRKLSKLNDPDELGIEKAMKKVKNDPDYPEIKSFMLKINGLKEVPTDLNSFRSE
jgi:hypothetical protein